MWWLELVELRSAVTKMLPIFLSLGKLKYLSSTGTPPFIRGGSRVCKKVHLHGDCTFNYSTCPVKDGEFFSLCSIDRDSHENLEKVKATVGLLMKGCFCKRSCCTRQCSCVKAERKCGPGCRCYNCVNASLSQSVGTAVEVDEMEAEECRIARELCWLMALKVI